MKDNKDGYSGLADLRDGLTGKQIDLTDIRNGAYIKNKKDLSDHGEKTTLYNEPTSKKNTLPSEYNGRNWDDLYQSDELETIRTKYPEHYEKLRKEKFEKND